MFRGEPKTTSQRNNSRERWRLLPLLQLAPALLYFSVLFVGPLVVMFGISFLTFRSYQYVEPLTLDNYLQVFGNEAFRAIAARTVILSLLAAALAVGLAYPFSYLITFVFRNRSSTFFFLVLVSLFGGYLVRIYAWRSILGAEGVINGTLMTLGVIDRPLRWMLNSPFAVVVASVSFLVPLAILPIYSSTRNVSPGLLDAARDLGASELDVSRNIVLPMVMPAVSVAFAFCFIAAAGEFAIPALLGGVDTSLIGNAIQYEFAQTGNWPLGAAMAVTLIALLVLISALVSWAGRRVVR